MQIWARGREEGGAQGPGDHTSTSLLPGASWGPAGGKFARVQAWPARGPAQLLAPAGLSPATSSHLRAMCALRPLLLAMDREIKEVLRSDGVQGLHLDRTFLLVPLSFPFIH